MHEKVSRPDTGPLQHVSRLLKERDYGPVVFASYSKVPTRAPERRLQPSISGKKKNHVV